jgi:hypothetical protein
MTIYPTVRPSLTLDFQKSKQLDPRISFSRSSSATYVEGGVIKYADEHQARFEEEGLLMEESRTNLLTQSEDFTQWPQDTAVTVTLNSGSAPDGSNTANRVQPTTANNRHQVRQNVTTTYASGASYSLTIYAKAGLNDQILLYFASGDFGYARGEFDLTALTATGLGGGTASIEQLPGNWRKLVLTVSATASGTVIPVHIGQDDVFGVGDPSQDYYLWGAQLEAGTFPTSYIPTTGSTVTRAVDIAQITGTNFSSWYNQSEGTVQVKYSSPTDTSSNYKRLVSISDSSSNSMSAGNGIMYGSHNPSTSTRWMARNGASIWYVALASPAALSSAIAYKDDNLAVSYDGGTVLTNNSYTISTLPSRLDVHPNGHISRLSYYSERLTDAQLEVLTS